LRSDEVEASTVSKRLDDTREARSRAGYPLALVEWQTLVRSRPRSIEDRRSDYLVRTVGFLIDEGPGVISVARSCCPTGGLPRRHAHPRGRSPAHRPASAPR
jgi:hypothetical protein